MYAEATARAAGDWNNATTVGLLNKSVHVLVYLLHLQ